MIHALDVAKYFLSLSDENAGDLISNLKLQKLLYYAQGFYLALNRQPLFAEPIEAWTHGPVVPVVYRAYRDFGSNALPTPTGLDLSVYDGKIKSHLDEVYKVYGQFSAWKLANMTHDEPPWKDAAPTKSEITQQALQLYFQTQISDALQTT
jgi:uncharacterized phage-associated protein